MCSKPKNLIINKNIMFKIFSLIFLTTNLIKCQNTTISNATANAQIVSPGDSAWMIVASILVMIMTPAVGFFYGGMVKTKNMISVLAQTFAIYAITTVVWTLIGFSLSFGGTNAGVWGDLQNFALNKVDYEPNSNYGSTIPFFLFYFFQTKFAVISPALIIGATAERVKFLPICIFSLIWTILVYCPIAHWNWNMGGWLNMLGTKDFAGGNVIHISAGISAIAIVFVIRDEINYRNIDNLQSEEPNLGFIRNQPKKGYMINEYEKTYSRPKSKSDSDDSKNSLVFVVIGTMLLWFGWFGFNGGSAFMAERSAILAIVNTNVSPCISLLTWVVLDLIFKGRPTLTGMCIGAVAGLVGITPAAGFCRVWAGVVIGVGSSFFPYMFTMIKDKYKLFDDRLDVFGCHGIAGIWGGFCVGLFYCDIKYDNTCDPNSSGAFYGNGGIQLVYQLIGIISTVSYCFVSSTIIMYLLKLTMKITVDRKLIDDGLDKVEFNENALDVFRKKNSIFFLRQNTNNEKNANTEQYLISNHKDGFPDENNVDECLSLSESQKFRNENQTQNKNTRLI